MRGKRVDWPVLVLVGILATLAGIAAWWWLDQRRPLEDDDDARDTRSEPPAERPAPAVAAAEAVPASPPGSADAEPAADAARPYGPGSAAADATGAGPDGWTVKGNADSGLYHTPSSPSWKRMRAEVWFESDAAAEAAGFKPWDWRRRAS